jgi:hypothetical protein
MGRQFAELDAAGIVVSVGAAPEDPEWAPVGFPWAWIQSGDAVLPGDKYEAGRFSRPAADLASRIAAATAAIQRALDTEAKTRGYDGILSLASYATSTSARFKAEALAGIRWRDAAWVWAGTYLADVQAGKRKELSIPEILAAMPKMEWPR